MKVIAGSDHGHSDVVLINDEYSLTFIVLAKEPYSQTKFIQWAFCFNIYAWSLA